MAALNFPNSPSLNDTHTENGVTFKWNGAAWDRLGDIGAQGSAGAAGAQGAAGSQGAAGAQGATGPVAGSSTQVVYKDGSNNPAGSSSFTFDGTNLTVGGNVSIGGTLTYEDVTNIDSVGLITARNGLHVTGGSFGIGTDNPGTNLDVLRTSNDTGGIIVRNTNNSQANARAQVEISGGDNADGRLKIECNGTEHTFRQDGNGNLQIHNASTERLRINANGVFDFKDNSFTNVGSIALDFIKGDADDDTNITFAGNDVITFKAGSTSPALTVNTTQVKVEDNQKFVAGTGNDFEIYHDGNNSAINDKGTGNLYIQGSSNIYIRDYDTSDSHIIMTKNGSVELYYDGSKKFETTSAGITVYNNVDFSSSTGRIRWPEHSNAASRAWDLIGEQGAYGRMELKYGGADGATPDEVSWRAIANGAVELYYDNSKKFETSSTGASVNGDLYLGDGSEIHLGNSADLRIYHNGSHSYIADEGSGELILSGSRIQLMNAARGEKAIDFVQNGAVDIYYNGSRKFQTKSDGVDINGELLSDSLKVYSGNTGTVDIADFYTSNNGSGGSNCRLKVRTYPNAGGDPFIFFDGGGTNFVVGEQWNGTTNNKLRLGAGNDMSSVTGIDITSNGDIESSNITISGFCNTHNVGNYSVFLSDNHANTFFGQNLRLDFSGTSGNHQLKVINQHSTVGGAGMLIGGNTSPYINQIKFYTVAGNQPAGTRVDDVADRMTIDSVGRITTPNQVSFFQRVMNGAEFNSGTLKGGSNDHNIGGHYNASTGIFTAPITGIYMFGCGILVNSSSGRLEGNISKNNSTRLVTFNGTGTTYDGPSATCVVSLSANDNVRVKRMSGTAYPYSHDNHYFWGRLMG